MSSIFLKKIKIFFKKLSSGFCGTLTGFCNLCVGGVIVSWYANGTAFEQKVLFRALAQAVCKRLTAGRVIVPAHGRYFWYIAAAAADKSSGGQARSLAGRARYHGYKTAGSRCSAGDLIGQRGEDTFIRFCRYGKGAERNERTGAFCSGGSRNGIGGVLPDGCCAYGMAALCGGCGCTGRRLGGDAAVGRTLPTNDHRAGFGRKYQPKPAGGAFRQPDTGGERG